MKKLLLLMLLSIPAFAQHAVTLNWIWTQTGGDSVSGFHVNRATTSGGPYTTISTVAATSISYVDSTVTAGQVLFYTITPFNTGGNAVSSNEVTCTVPFSPPTGTTTLSATVK